MKEREIRADVACMANVVLSSQCLKPLLQVVFALDLI